MRWLAVWLLLTGVYLAGQFAAPLAAGGAWRYTRENLAHLALVPAVQAAALYVVALVRRHSRRPHRPAGRAAEPPSK